MSSAGRSSQVERCLFARERSKEGSPAGFITVGLGRSRKDNAIGNAKRRKNELAHASPHVSKAAYVCAVGTSVPET